MDLGLNITGVTEKTFKVMSPISAILFQMIKVGGIMLDTEKIEVNLKRNSGEDVALIDPIKIADYLEQNSEDEEFYVNKDGQALGAIKFTADKEVGLTLDPANHEYIEIKLSGLRSTYTYNVFGVEAFENSNVALQIDVKTLTNKKQKINVLGYDQVNLPLAQLTKVTLKNKEGETIEQSKDFMSAVSMLNGEVKNIGNVTADTNTGVVSGVVDMYMNKQFVSIDVEDIYEIEISAVANYEFNLIKNKTI